MHKHFSGIRLGFVVGTYKARTFHSQDRQYVKFMDNGKLFLSSLA